MLAACDIGLLDQQYFTLLNSVAAVGPDGRLALETTGGADLK
jgi:hypothetical protein